MATVKVKYRPSTVDDSHGYIYYQVIHNRISRQQKTGYLIHAYEWDTEASEVHVQSEVESRYQYLSEISKNIHSDILCFSRIISRLEQKGDPYTADEVITEFTIRKSDSQLFPFMERLISNLKTYGKLRTSETYETTLNSFKRFRNGKDLSLNDLDCEIIMSYEAYLRNKGIRPNSSSFYLRNLRAVYNRSVEKGLTEQKYPFRHVYTGVDKTVKRAVSLQAIRKIKEMDFSKSRSYAFARDMFMFSFYTRGMSFVDMAYLRKKDLTNGILSYRRRKTGQQLLIKWEKCMQEIVDRYDDPFSEYLLPVIKPHKDTDIRRQYIYVAHNINRCLRIIGQKMELSVTLTMYVARHAWASIAKSKNIPISIISEGLGHDSESTTRIYLASLDTLAIDKANSMILRSL